MKNLWILYKPDLHCCKTNDSAWARFILTIANIPVSEVESKSLCILLSIIILFFLLQAIYYFRSSKFNNELRAECENLPDFNIKI